MGILKSIVRMSLQGESAPSDDELCVCRQHSSDQAADANMSADGSQTNAISVTTTLSKQVH